LQANTLYLTYKESLVFSELVLLLKHLSAGNISALYQKLQLAGNIKRTLQLEDTNKEG
jgi:hypothetical protein